MSNSSSMRVGIIGNPNSGKSTLFNALTGGKQTVGNWPGVTVERKNGYFTHSNKKVELIDLPGVYTLTVINEESSLDARIACESLFSEHFDLIINVIDVNNLERNLYLTTQLLEMGKPVLIVANMLDVAQKHGISIDLEQLAQSLNCPVVALSANKKSKIPELKETIASFEPRNQQPLVLYPEPLQHTLQQLSHQIKPYFHGDESIARFFAMRLLEGADLPKDSIPQDLLACLRGQIVEMEAALQEDADIVIADARYTCAYKIRHNVTQKVDTHAQTITQKIDKVVLHRVFGIPIFLAVMYAMFFFSINIAGALQSFFDIASSTIFVEGVGALLASWGAPSVVSTVLADGVGSGITTVLTFIPVICGLFLFLSFLEGTGYMARASFVVDRCMRALGLPGKSFVPLIVGFGCNVPAVMATRTLEQRRDRLLTLMMTPFMSCGARMAIYAVFTAAFFPKNGSNVVFFLYLIGILMAILTGIILKKTVLAGSSSQWVVELPTYHIPTPMALWRQTWHRLAQFLWKAGKYIVAACLILSVLNAVTVNKEQESVLAVTAKSITPIFAPMGIQENNWPATVGLISGVLAKEVVVGTLNTLYTQQAPEAVSEKSFDLLGGLSSAARSIPEGFAGLKKSVVNPIVGDVDGEAMTGTAMGVMSAYFDGAAGALAYMLFVLLYFPCVSVVAALIRESSARWAMFSVAWTTGLAYTVAVIFYQSATFMQHPAFSTAWIGGLLLALFGAVWLIQWYAKREEKIEGNQHVAF